MNAARCVACLLHNMSVFCWQCCRLHATSHKSHKTTKINTGILRLYSLWIMVVVKLKIYI